MFDALRERIMGVSVMGRLETKNDLQEREKERESGGWARIKGV